MNPDVDIDDLKIGQSLWRSNISGELSPAPDDLCDTSESIDISFFGNSSNYGSYQTPFTEFENDSAQNGATR